MSSEIDNLISPTFFSLVKPATVRKKRKCIGVNCGKVFESASSSNRLCSDCKFKANKSSNRALEGVAL